MLPLLNMSSSLVPLTEQGSTNLHTWTGTYWSDIWYFPQHYQLWYLRDGQGTLTFAKRSLLLQSGALHFVCPGQSNKGKPIAGSHWSVALLNIEAAYLQAKLTRLNRPITTLLTVARQLQQNGSLRHHVVQQLQTLIQKSQPTQSVGERAYQLDQFLDRLVDALEDISVSDSPPLPTAISRSVTYLQAHYRQPIRLDELAQQACLSKFRLIHSFADQTGLTPHQFQLQLRLHEARRLLHQQHSIGEVAFQLGFVDVAHFSHVFKRHTRLAPKAYQQRLGHLVVT